MNVKDYKRLFEDYYQALCQFALAMTNDRAEAEDMVQEVFINLWNKRDELNINPKYLKTYLHTAVKNKIYEKNRNNKLKTISSDYTDEQKNVAVDNNEPNFDEILLISRLYTSIRHLPNKCSRIFAMSKLEGKSHATISNELGISVKTIENQMTKAYKLLRENLKDLL